MGHDEQVYVEDAEALRREGVQGLKRRVAKVLRGDEPTFAMRYGWLVLVAVFGRGASLAGIVLAPILAGLLFGPWGALLAASSPLLWQTGRRCLQDSTVAAGVLLLALAVKAHSLWGILGATFVLLSMKEAAALYLPAIWLFWPAWDSAIWMWLGGMCWWCGELLLFEDLVFRLWKRATRHAGEYNERESRGMPHRLLVDLAMVSPFVLLAFARFSTWAEVAIVTAGLVPLVLSPVRNARTVIAFDLIMRGVAAKSMNPYAIAACVAFDVWVAWKIRNVYDPVSSALVKRVCLEEKQEPSVIDLWVPFETPERIAGLVVCVGETYAQTLEATLPRWLDSLDSVCVVTKPDDQSTLQVLDDYACDKLRVYTTDCFDKDGAVFNKGRAMSEAVHAGAVDTSAWVLTFDADVLPPLDWREGLKLQRHVVYGSRRVSACTTASVHGRQFTEGHDIDDGHGDPVGAFTLFWGPSPEAARSPMFDVCYPSAGGVDSEFVWRWPPYRRQLLPILLLHYGRPFSNWFGVGREQEFASYYDAMLAGNALEKVNVPWPPQVASDSQTG